MKRKILGENRGTSEFSPSLDDSTDSQCDQLRFSIFTTVKISENDKVSV